MDTNVFWFLLKLDPEVTFTNQRNQAYLICQNYEYFCQAQPMYEKYVENFFIILLYNFPCVYSTNVEGPTIPNNLNSDK